MHQRRVPQFLLIPPGPPLGVLIYVHSCAPMYYVRSRSSCPKLPNNTTCIFQDTAGQMALEGGAQFQYELEHTNLHEHCKQAFEYKALLDNALIKKSTDFITKYKFELSADKNIKLGTH